MRFRPRNRDGTPIDPVPFLVVALTAFLITHAWGPLYLGVLGVSPLVSLVVLTALLAVVVAVAYHQLVWTVDPDRPSVGVDQRLSYLLYAVAIGIALIVLLAIPFLV
ncbi:hypothetical protein [Natronobeatus ordinarius]|uniref:hypothetical protein n=1 Tax=Natronobeatus ordinarius TaxID=2963433 RepID=UPI0020CEB270|nr:hypothetical protein [Natronobeatus ordinarius]